MKRETLRSSFNGVDSCLTYRFTLCLALAPPLDECQLSLNNVISRYKRRRALTNNCGLPDKLCCSWGPYFSWEWCTASTCYLMMEWPLELDMRRELAPFGLCVGPSRLTESSRQL
jgi:hypothetical protein